MDWESKKIDALIAFALNILFLLIYIYCFVPIQESNDDLAMSFLVEGAYGTHSEYIVFENILWGKILVGMGKLIPMVKWFNVMSYAMIFTAFIEMTYAFLRVHGRKIGVALSAIMLIFGGHHTYIMFQFSRVTAIGAIGGMIMLFYALDYAKEKTERRICVIAGGVLTVWSSMMRFEMFALSVVLVGGALALYRLFVIWKEKSTDAKKQILTYLGVFGAVGIISIGLYVVNQIAYQSDETWAEYTEYNKLRAELWDKGFPDYEANAPLYESLGISHNDYLYYLNWEMDEEALSLDTLRTLVAAKTPKERSLREFLSMFPKDFVPLTVYILFWVTGIVAIALNKKNAYFVAFEFVAVMAAELLFYYMGRYGFPRVDSSMWIAAVIVVMYGMARDFAEYEVETGRWAIASIAIAIILNSAWLHDFTHIQVGKVGSTKAAYQEIISDKEHLYVMLNTAPWVYYAYNFWEPCGVGDLSNVYNAFGWEYNVESKHDILESYGVKNVYRDGINNEKVYFIGGSDSVKLEQYVRENYNADAQFYPVKEIMGNYVWSIRTGE